MGQKASMTTHTRWLSFDTSQQLRRSGLLTRRETISVPGLKHGDLPIPVATKIDNFVFSSGIHPLDINSGTIPEDPAHQVKLVFQHAETIVETAGGTAEDIALMTFSITDDTIRPLVNDEWVRMFPDPASWPARNSYITDLGFGMRIHIMMQAILPAT